MLLEKIKELVPLVGAWSVRNFGKQASKKSDTTLNEISPLLGMFEEFGEIEDAATDEMKLDGVADVLVFLCDFCKRDNVPLDILSIGGDRPGDTPVKIMGRLAHCVLKSHQGIRTFADPNVYNSARADAISSILGYLVKTYGEQTCTDILHTTWYDKVSLRNWVANPNDAADVVEAAKEEPQAEPQAEPATMAVVDETTEEPTAEHKKRIRKGAPVPEDKTEAPIGHIDPPAVK